MSKYSRSLVRRGALVAALGLAAAAVSMPAVGASNQIPLNTGQEAASQGIPVNTGAHGWFTYSIEGDELCYTLMVDGLSSPATNAHIHVGPRTVIGPPVVQLDFERTTSFTVSECVMPAPEVLAAIEENPKSYYVNVHSGMFPVGELRGQLR
ncbi:CHRD domain-containing protein [Isoptericola variabilis]|uniref:CHRD domain containing protein n=1 Tax=Isoptericola variabilis (strain 225) TaxID=743718 RepID=F6FRB9_ISOV2|nr:CHRD domain-containing protein [Isoptericola variabilis]AEG43880.1 CHRD domain containing protein [Isoptericola variabilis 225]TWH30470.1 CHRD domain-containing protein [Isoptericola variabilis J7]